MEKLLGQLFMYWNDTLYPLLFGGLTRMELHNFWTQVFFPILFGGIISLLRFSFQEESSSSKEKTKHSRNKVKHFVSGSLAGVVAVNMFNPKGTFDQIVVISVFAATHGIAWVLANSFVSSKNANEILKELQERDSETINTVLDQDVTTEEDIDKAVTLVEEAIMKDPQ